MADAILVLNAGSSSIKFSVFTQGGGEWTAHIQSQIEGLYTAARFVSRAADGEVRSERSWPAGTKLGHDGALDHLIGHLRSELGDNRLIGIGHRVVHGGAVFREPTLVDAEVLKTLETFVSAPLHQPHNLAPIRRALGRAPELPQVACFDTSFHRDPQPSLPRRALAGGRNRRGGQRRWARAYQRRC